MGWGERIFHAVLFEILAIVLSIVGLYFFTNHDVSLLSGTMIVVSIIAVLWNFLFNWIFDRFYLGEREKRSISIRFIHVSLFEVGLWIFTLPAISILLGISLWDALIMDISVTIFITIYAFLFNYIYDHTRIYFLNIRLKKDKIF